MNNEINKSNSISTKIIIIIVLMLGTFGAKAQKDTLLPKGKSTIYLISGNTIKNVEIRIIDSLKIEYINEGNLADIKTESVSMIIFSDGTIKKLHDAKNANQTKFSNTNFESIKPGIAKHLHFSIGFGNGIDSRHVYSDMNNMGFRQYLGYHYNKQATPTLEIEYSIYPKWKVGYSQQRYSNYFSGEKGPMLYSSFWQFPEQNFYEILEGKRYFFNATHLIYELLKPIRISFSAGSAIMYNTVKYEGFFFACDTINTNQPSLYDSNFVSQANSINEKRQSFGIELFGTVELYVWKSFSIFLKPSYTFDEGFVIPEQKFTFPKKTIYFPEQKINISDFGIQWGFAFHFLNFKKKNNI